MEILTSEFSSKAFRLSYQEEGIEIGYAHLYLITNKLHNRPYGLLEDVFVLEDARGRGIGTVLIREAIATARRCGCYKLIATSRLERESVHGLYEKLGLLKYGHEFRVNL